MVVDRGVTRWSCREVKLWCEGVNEQEWSQQPNFPRTKKCGIDPVEISVREKGFSSQPFVYHPSTIPLEHTCMCIGDYASRGSRPQGSPGRRIFSFLLCTALLTAELLFLSSPPACSLAYRFAVCILHRCSSPSPPPSHSIRIPTIPTVPLTIPL